MTKTFTLIILLAMAITSCKNATQTTDTIGKLPQTENSIVRLSKIEVYPEWLEAYKRFAVEVGETSLRTEPGVLSMYGVAEKANPCRITILEIYADTASYKSHIQSAHFQKYKQGTLQMVKSLELIDNNVLNPKMQLTNTLK